MLIRELLVLYFLSLSPRALSLFFKLSSVKAHVTHSKYQIHNYYFFLLSISVDEAKSIKLFTVHRNKLLSL